MRNIVDELIGKIKEYNNPTVMGLDPTFDYIPTGIKKANRIDMMNESIEESNVDVPAAILEFNKKLIDAVYDVIPAIKPNLAFYEVYGSEGLKTFAKTCNYAKGKGMFVIADAKRNDIGSTAQRYALSFFKDEDEIDFVTVNGYLGEDGVKPFIDVSAKSGYKKGIFVLVKTSNPSSGQLQDLKLENGKTVYEQMADWVTTWGKDNIGENGYGIVGAVVGATYPEQLATLRQRMPNAFILIPGYGAQGGTAKDIAVGFDKNKAGAIVNSSRGLMCAYKSDKWKNEYNEEQFAGAARAEAIRMREDIVSSL